MPKFNFQKKSIKQMRNMKNLFIAFSIIGLAACSSGPNGDKALVEEAQTVDSSTGSSVLIDLATSKVGFVGNGVGKNHPGYFRLSEGSVTVKDGKLAGGKFVIDTKSLELEQKDEMFQTKLRGHLLGADFLDAEKYSSALFEVTSVEAFTPAAGDTSIIEGANFKVSGNLTLKEVTKNVTFPAKIEAGAANFSALASFNVDRKLWGINYGNDKSLKDKFISEIVNISLDIKSK